jgi:hypothetical protein
MPGGIYDSSKTRVAPVFSALRECGADWLPALLALAVGNSAVTRQSGDDLSFLRGYWGEAELAVPPPVSLLSWMIRNPCSLKRATATNPDRLKLLAGDAETTERALDLLRSDAAHRAWYIFEGPTVPDAWIETPDTLIVVEGKRTEPGPTTETTWLSGRHQIWRHIDAAWERRGGRKVYGLFIVEGLDSTPEVPPMWLDAVTDAISAEALESSFPHRGQGERSAIASCLLGVTSWQRVVDAFGLPKSVLIDRLS